jgi:hypothetical protein
MKRLITSATSTSAIVLGVAATVGAMLSVAVVAFANTATAGQFTVARGSVDPTTLLESFQRPRTSQDALSAEVEARLHSLSSTAPSDAVAPGDPVVSQSRRVTHEDGTTFFLTPTSRSQVCIAVEPGGAAGCTTGARLARDGVEFQLLDTDGLGQGDPTVIRGIVARDIADLEIAYEDGSRDARLVEGTFSIRLSNVPTAVNVRTSEGTTRRLTIPAPPQP